MSYESGKSMAGIGALLLVIGSFVPFLGIVGLILLLIGMNDLAEYYKDKSIFQDALYGVIFGIIGIAAVGLGVLSLFTGAGLVVGVILGLVVAFIFYIIMAMYFRRAFDSLANKTGEGRFKTAGLLLFIGAILTIIVIGLILIFVAWILITVAFFSLRTAAEPPPPPPPPPAP